MSKEITVVIADDHPVFLRGLCQAIEADRSLRIVGEAANSNEALARAVALQPRVLVLDVDMPGQDGFAVARALFVGATNPAIIFLARRDDEAVFNAALNLGVKGYILKDSAITELVEAIKIVAAGRHYFSPALSTYLLRRADGFGGAGLNKPGLSELTPAERRVLRLVAQHKSTKEIAAELFVSHRTIDHHRASICAKLDLHGPNALYKYAVAHQSEIP